MDVFFSTGEKSGERIAGDIAAALREALGAELDMAGLGGPPAAEAGIRNVFDGTRLATVGAELGKLSAWKDVLAAAGRILNRRPPRLFVAVAHPTFNLPLAGLLPAGVRRVMIAPPEIWAWHVPWHGRAVAAALSVLGRIGGPLGALRASAIAAARGRLAVENFHELLCLTPMNAASYAEGARRRGTETKVLQVEHPAARLRREPADDDGARGLRAELSVAPDEHLVGIFPGSRRGEIALLLPTMLRAAGILARQRSDVRLAVSAAGEGLKGPIEELVGRSGLGPVRVVGPGRTRQLMCASCHAIMSSGTATLEAACLGVPVTVGYTLGYLSRFLLRPFFSHHRIAGMRMPFALPNAILLHAGAERGLLPYEEFIARHFRPSKLAGSVLRRLPSGRHTPDCPAPLPAETVRSLRDRLAGPYPRLGPYLVEMLRGLP